MAVARAAAATIGADGRRPSWQGDAASAAQEQSFIISHPVAELGLSKKLRFAARPSFRTLATHVARLTTSPSGSSLPLEAITFSYVDARVVRHAVRDEPGLAELYEGAGGGEALRLKVGVREAGVPGLGVREVNQVLRSMFAKSQAEDSTIPVSLSQAFTPIVASPPLPLESGPFASPSIARKPFALPVKPAHSNQLSADASGSGASTSSWERSLAVAQDRVRSAGTVERLRTLVDELHASLVRMEAIYASTLPLQQAEAAALDRVLDDDIRTPLPLPLPATHGPWGQQSASPELQHPVPRPTFHPPPFSPATPPFRFAPDLDTPPRIVSPSFSARDEEDGDGDGDGEGGTRVDKGSWAFLPTALDLDLSGSFHVPPLSSPHSALDDPHSLGPRSSRTSAADNLLSTLTPRDPFAPGAHSSLKLGTHDRLSTPADDAFAPLRLAGSTTTNSPPPGSRRDSSAGRNAHAEAARRRWIDPPEPAVNSGEGAVSSDQLQESGREERPWQRQRRPSTASSSETSSAGTPSDGSGSQHEKRKKHAEYVLKVVDGGGSPPITTAPTITLAPGHAHSQSWAGTAPTHHSGARSQQQQQPIHLAAQYSSHMQQQQQQQQWAWAPPPSSTSSRATHVFVPFGSLAFAPPGAGSGAHAGPVAWQAQQGGMMMVTSAAHQQQQQQQQAKMQHLISQQQQQMQQMGMAAASLSSTFAQGRATSWGSLSASARPPPVPFFQSDYAVAAAATATQASSSGATHYTHVHHLSSSSATRAPGKHNPSSSSSAAVPHYHLPPPPSPGRTSPPPMPPHVLPAYLQLYAEHFGDAESRLREADQRLRKVRRREEGEGWVEDGQA